MPESMTTAVDERAAALLRVAAYLSRPQKFMAGGEARAELRRTLELAEEGSVVLTTHGEPEAAEAMAAHIRERFGWRVDAPHYGQSVELE